MPGKLYSWKFIFGFLKAKTTRQTAVLYLSRIAAMFLGMFATLIVTRKLGPEQYGIYAFILSLTAFISLFFEFGYFTAGARLLAISRDKAEEKELIGALVLITLAISLSFFLMIFIFSFFVNGIFKTTAGNILRGVSVLAAVLPFQYMIQQASKGTNEINKNALISAVPKIWTLAGVLFLLKFSLLSAFSAVVVDFSGISAITLYVIYALKPRFSNLAQTVKLIHKENKEYGFYIYMGRTINSSAGQLDTVLISYFIDTTSMGFYNLAKLMTMPMILYSESIATSLFKNFSEKERIPAKVNAANAAWLLICVTGLALLGRPVLVMLFTNKYIESVPFILPLAAASFFRGMFQPYAVFLSVKKKGQWARQILISNAVVIIVLNLVLIPRFRAMGAAVAGVISSVFVYVLYLFYYSKYVKETGADNR